MQALTVTLKQDAARQRIEWSQVVKAPLSWLTRAFGCWHREMSRPFTLQRAGSYRVCLECGAHRRFDLKAWEMTGPYYYEPAASLAEIYRNSAAAAAVAPARRNQRAALPMAA